MVFSCGGVGCLFLGFVLPETLDPMGIPNPAHFSLYEALRYSSALYILPLLYIGAPAEVFIGLFLFWRFMYNGFLGYILYRQSEDQILTRFMQSKTAEKYKGILKFAFVRMMKSDYVYEDAPVEFNAWILFRLMVELILSNDLVCYIVMCLKYLQPPGDLGFIYYFFCYLSGVALCLIALWAKTNAYSAVKDFAWCMMYL